MSLDLSSIDPARTALLIVDLQNDFLAPDGAYARGGAVAPAAAALPARVARVARAVKAAGGMVAASQFTLWPDGRGEPMVAPHLLSLRPFLRKGDFAPGSRGQANVDALEGLVDVSVCKVAYSAFFNTQLDWVLRHAGVDTVAVCGIVTNGGVASTVRDAHMREYHVVVLADGCAAFREEVHATALADMAGIAGVTDCPTFERSLAARRNA
ncbi:Peroxyureidoacrylate/ureidoacrylate amidohydrolase RutB [Pigmentiphaga humi]|uniref:Peroxyureidoacrylate/ureidoacrylate amidohydrolase RutB n=1 Tax=Pigmentiphaga humi TaxID=2478468 RepID=A0A3P4AZF2_9BURK|nr:isochorismatase family cysteine hydrolase [Pigmentiphaga humi]VCU68746.1 Peroxyureidoacrylate/ureidoacrylate amidohydrolase RutB [Pigmentiphaga humi]